MRGVDALVARRVPLGYFWSLRDARADAVRLRKHGWPTANVRRSLLCNTPPYVVDAYGVADPCDGVALDVER